MREVLFYDISWIKGSTSGSHQAKAFPTYRQFNCDNSRGGWPLRLVVGGVRVHPENTNLSVPDCLPRQSAPRGLHGGRIVWREIHLLHVFGKRAGKFVCMQKSTPGKINAEVRGGIARKRGLHHPNARSSTNFQSRPGQNFKEHDAGVARNRATEAGTCTKECASTS